MSAVMDDYKFNTLTVGDLRKLIRGKPDSMMVLLDTGYMDCSHNRFEEVSAEMFHDVQDGDILMLSSNQPGEEDESEDEEEVL